MPKSPFRQGKASAYRTGGGLGPSTPGGGGPKLELLLLVVVAIELTLLLYLQLRLNKRLEAKTTGNLPVQDVENTNSTL